MTLQNKNGSIVFGKEIKVYIKLFYKTDELGNLFFEKDKFRYEPTNLKVDHLKPVLVLKNLDNLEIIEKDELFSIFEEIYQSVVNRKDILSRLGHIDTKDKFKVLYEFAKLPQYEQNFYLKAIKK